MEQKPKSIQIEEYALIVFSVDKGDHIAHGDMMFNFGEEDYVFDSEDRKILKNKTMLSYTLRGSVVDPNMKWTSPIPYILKTDQLGKPFLTLPYDANNV